MDTPAETRERRCWLFLAKPLSFVCYTCSFRAVLRMSAMMWSAHTSVFAYTTWEFTAHCSVIYPPVDSDHYIVCACVFFFFFFSASRGSRCSVRISFVWVAIAGARTCTKFAPEISDAWAGRAHTTCDRARGNIMWEWWRMNQSCFDRVKCVGIVIALFLLECRHRRRVHYHFHEIGKTETHENTVNC